MSPLRIIVIAILIYIAYRLITGGTGKSSSTGRIWKNRSAGEVPVSDTLEEDPVCKKLVPRRQAVHYEYHGKKLYFCSKECCNTFRSNQGEHS